VLLSLSFSFNLSMIVHVSPPLVLAYSRLLCLSAYLLPAVARRALPATSVSGGTNSASSEPSGEDAASAILESAGQRDKQRQEKEEKDSQGKGRQQGEREREGKGRAMKEERERGKPTVEADALCPSLHLLSRYSKGHSNTRAPVVQCACLVVS
jgi:hypothetical protein